MCINTAPFDIHPILIDIMPIKDSNASKSLIASIRATVQYFHHNPHLFLSVPLATRRQHNTRYPLELEFEAVLLHCSTPLSSVQGYERLSVLGFLLKKKQANMPGLLISFVVSSILLVDEDSNAVMLMKYRLEAFLLLTPAGTSMEGSKLLWSATPPSSSSKEFVEKTPPVGVSSSESVDILPLFSSVKSSPLNINYEFLQEILDASNYNLIMYILIFRDQFRHLLQQYFHQEE
ncbi:hypothetical protein Tco_0400211 [Tanacetum coccineum]